MIRPFHPKPNFMSICIVMIMTILMPKTRSSTNEGKSNPINFWFFLILIRFILFHFDLNSRSNFESKNDGENSTMESFEDIKLYMNRLIGYFLYETINNLKEAKKRRLWDKTAWSSGFGCVCDRTFGLNYATTNKLFQEIQMRMEVVTRSIFGFDAFLVGNGNAGKHKHECSE